MKKAFVACIAVGVSAFALVPYVHPFLHEGEAFAAALSGLGLALLSTRLIAKRSEIDAAATRARRARRIQELAR